jgi:hypothetical protein
MAAQEKQVKIIEGSTDLLIIAPHGVRGKMVRKDDINTDFLADAVAEELGCSAIINDSIKRSECDYNRISKATKDKRFISGIRKVLDADGSTLLVWIHGLKEKSELSEKALMKVAELDCLIGCGQPANLSTREEAATDLETLLQKHGIRAYKTRKRAKNFRGADPDNMNQWFRQQKEYNDLSRVQSVQLEFSMQLRQVESIQNTARAISKVLSSFLRLPQLKVVKLDAEKAPDEKLVSETYEYLHEVVQPHFHKAMLAAGTHIIENFFDGDFERAKNPRNATKIHSFNELTRRLQGTDGHGPSKTWVYNAIKLAVDENQFKRFSVYGKLGLSHKVYLTHVKDLETKRKLIQEAVENSYTVAQTRSRIAEVQGSDPHETFSFDSIPSDDELEKVGRDELLRRKKVVLSRFDFYKNKMEHFQKYQDSITRVLKTIASKSNAHRDHINVIDLPSKEAAEPEHQNQKREQGVI